MRRRSYLAAAAAALAGGTGCLGRRASDGGADATTTETTTRTTASTTTRTTKPTTATTSTVNRSVVVRETTLQPALVFLQTDYLSVRNGGQYLLVDVGVSGKPLERDGFSFRFDGETYAPAEPVRTRRLWRVYNSGNDYEASENGGLLVFGLPASANTDDPEAVLEWPGGGHTIRGDVRARLAASPPALSFTADIPGTVTMGESPRIRLSVRNEGDVAGRFLAGLNRSGPRVASAPVDRISTLVPGGGTARVEVVDDSVTGDAVSSEQTGDGEADLEYRLDAVGDRDVRQDVRYVSGDA